MSATKDQLEINFDGAAELPLLRVSTAGSVDDGKSSLIGRLLYDSKSIFEDQLAAIERASHRRGSEGMELALLTDGLRAEREQNITIDVAYRYFATPARKFIIADTPGHEQYTRNMVTGTSTSDVSIVLVDARKGVLPQSRRHAAISALLGIKVVIVAVNKMDLVDFSEFRFEEIRREFLDQTAGLELERVEFFPISALLGDNVVESSEKLSWFQGPTLLKFLENVEIPAQRTLDGLRLPIQYVVRPDQDFRGFAGQIEAGSISPRDRVRLLPSQRLAEVEAVYGPDGALEQAIVGTPVVVTLTEHVDLSRGEMIVSEDRLPFSSGTVDVTVCWMSSEPAIPGKRYTILHANRQVSGHILSIISRISIDSLTEEPAGELRLNDIGRVILETSRPLHFDRYKECKTTGSLIFVDPGTSVTIGAGMLQSPTDVRSESNRSLQSLFLKISGGTESEREQCAELMQARLRHRGIPAVGAELEELRQTVLSANVDALSNLISVLAKSNVGLVVNDGSLEALTPLTVSRFDQDLWIETHSWIQDRSLEEFIAEALNEKWSPEI